jgi:putative aldouronate transport system substrate-binding protein
MKLSSKVERRLTILLVLLLLASSLSACVATAPDSPPAVSDSDAAADSPTEITFPLPEKTTLSVAVAKWGPHGSFEEMDVVQDWEAKTNVQLDWTVIPVETKNEKVQLMFATGDLPDVFFGLLSNLDTVNYGSQGLIIPLEGLIDSHMPNLKALFEQRPELKASLTASDGHIYSFPKVDETEAEEVLNKAYINAEWLDTLGLEMPTTTEEFYTVLKAFKEGDPNGNGQADEIPFTALGNWGPEFSFGIYPLFHAFGVPDMPNHIAVQDGKVIYAPTLPGYRDAMTFFNRLYTEGLADQELFTQSFAQMTAKGSVEEAVYGSFVSYLDTVTLGGAKDEEYVVLPPLKGPNGDQGWPRLLGRMYLLNNTQISHTNPQPELTAAWIDRFYEPRQSAINMWGAVGDVVSEGPNGLLVFNPTPEGMSFAEFRHQSTPGGVIPTAVLKEYWDTVIAFPEEKKAVTEDIQPFLPYLTEENFPFIFLFSLEESDLQTKLATDIESLVSQMTAQWITAAPPSDAEWEEYLSSLERMGLNDLLAVYQGAYDRYRSAAQ